MFRSIFTIGFVLLLWAAQLQADRLFVPTDFPTIQDAINAANDGHDQIFVADGTYYENINFKGKAIYIGSLFSTTGDTIHINNTVINGSKPVNPDSGSVVFFISGEDTTSVICGFTITGGTGTIVTAPGEPPARVGGGIFCYNSGARIINNKIIENTVNSPDNDVLGGGLAALPITSTAHVILQDNQISNNTLTVTADSKDALGGGVELMGNGMIVNNLISYNSIVHNATNRQAFSGGLDCFSLSTDRRKVIVESNKITHNSVNSKSNIENNLSASGGGISIDGSYGSFVKNEVSYNELWANSDKGAGGAGIFINHAPDSLIIEGNIIRKNAIKQGNGFAGGVLIARNSSPRVINNIIEGNSATFGGGFIISGGAVQLINNTVINNQATSGGGINVRGTSTIYLMNSILWGNQASTYAGIQLEDGTVQAAYCDIQGGWSGTAIIKDDPQLSDSFTLLDSSPCIGRGIASFDFGGVIACNCPPTDYNGNQRPNPVDEFVDIGALESEFLKTGDGVEEKRELIPANFTLEQNYPNPFNPSTTIEFALSKSSFVTLNVYNLLGEAVVTLIAEKRSAGDYKVNWDASGLTSGVYLYRLEAGNFVQGKKLILMR